MRKSWSEKLKSFVRPQLYKLTAGALKPHFDCPICGYRGPFKSKLVTQPFLMVREHSKCPRCVSTERHRMMYLCLSELFLTYDPEVKSILHVAPEGCLESFLREKFKEYLSMDLFRKDVDVTEDLQKLSFEDSSFDMVLESRVLISPPDINACLSEIHRVLRPGGLFVAAELYALKYTKEYASPEGDRHRELGVDMFERYRQFFPHIKIVYSSDFLEKYQTNNLTTLDGEVYDQYPPEVRLKNKGIKDVVVLCYK